MKKRITLLLVVLSSVAFAQDYLVEEKYNPESYSRNPFSGNAENPNHRGIYGWGLYDHAGAESPTTNRWGSNHFNIRYQYNQKLFLGTFLVFGTGYNWNSFNLLKSETSFYNDSTEYDKRKFRFQNITSHLGLRFQTNENPDESFFLQVNGYWDILTHTAFNGWLEDENGVKIRNRKTKLNDTKINTFGLELRTGYAPFALFARYRLSDIFDNSVIDLPLFNFGIDIEIPSGD